MVALTMLHEVDPREEALAKIGDLGNVDVFHNQVLVVTYVRPEKTRSGIILSDTTRKEDEYQGKVGLVVKKGPMAFVDDDRVQFHGQNVSVGDWITYRFSDGFPLEINGVHCRLLEDSHVRLRIASPDTIR